jgi:hypothetical protein
MKDELFKAIQDKFPNVDRSYIYHWLQCIVPDVVDDETGIHHDIVFGVDYEQDLDYNLESFEKWYKEETFDEEAEKRKAQLNHLWNVHSDKLSELLNILGRVMGLPAEQWLKVLNQFKAEKHLIFSALLLSGNDMPSINFIKSLLLEEKTVDEIEELLKEKLMGAFKV